MNQLVRMLEMLSHLSLSTILVWDILPALITLTQHLNRSKHQV